jgi:hypothetical protein
MTSWAYALHVRSQHAGLGAVGVALVAVAAKGLVSKAIKGPLTSMILLASACISYMVSTAWLFPALIVAGGVATLLVNTFVTHAHMGLAVRPPLCWGHTTRPTTLSWQHLSHAHRSSVISTSACEPNTREARQGHGSHACACDVLKCSGARGGDWKLPFARSGRVVCMHAAAECARRGGHARHACSR